MQLPPSICQALSQEELFYLSRPGAAEEQLAPVCSDGTWGGGTLFDCLLLFEEQVDMLFALHVPDEWRLARPYWSGCQLLDALTMEDHDVVAGIPFTHCLEAPARFVLIQDVQGGIFAEIHCLCGTTEGVISVIEVVDILANDQARTWLQGQQNTQWENMAQQIQSWGLHSF